VSFAVGLSLESLGKNSFLRSSQMLYLSIPILWFILAETGGGLEDTGDSLEELPLKHDSRMLLVLCESTSMLS
jgi:hypothetical protein